MFLHGAAADEGKQKWISDLSSPPNAQRTGAVVVGGCFQGLGIVRSLGRRGIPVCIIDDEASISRFSRYATLTARVPDLLDEQNAVEGVLEVGRKLKLKDWILYPTRDETVAAFSRYRVQLGELYRVPTPAWEVIRWAWDKRNTYQLAQELGIPAPRTWNPKDPDELKQLELQFPLAIKPAVKEHFIYATKAKAWRADTHEELVKRFAQATAIVEPGEVMIQELIPGDGRQQFAYCAFFKSGKAFGSMVVQRLRQHPPEFGRASTFVETVDLPLLERYSETFLKAIDYYGLVELEYKFDPRDNQYKLLDFNARTWGYHTLGQRAGVDFPYLLFADQCSEAVEEYHATPGIGWIRLVTDLATAAVEIRRGHLALSTYLRSLKGINIESVFSRDDLLPGFMELLLVPYFIMRRGF